MPPISRSDFPYPLRTINGIVDAEIDLLSVTNVVVTGAVNIDSLTPNQIVATDSSKKLITVPTTGSGNVVLQTNPSLISPSLGTATASSLVLSTPLLPASGGTGQTNLAAVTVGAATTASVATQSLNLAAGLAGAVPYQVATNTTGFVPAGTSGAVFTFQTTPSWQQSVSVSGNIIAGAFLNSNSGANATTISNGAIAAPSGGISCAQNIFAGGNIISQTTLSSQQTTGTGLSVSSTTDSTNTASGSIVTAGGIGAAKNIYSGGQMRSLFGQNSTSATTGGITTTGGIGCSQDLYADGLIHTAKTTGQNSFDSIDDGPIQNQSYCIRAKGGIQIDKSLRVVNGPIEAGNADARFNTVDAISTAQATGFNTGAIHTGGGASILRKLYVGDDLICPSITLNGNAFVNCLNGTFTPFFQSLDPALQGTFNTYNVTYISQNGTYQMMNSWMMVFVEIVYTLSSVSGPSVHYSIGGFPGTYPAGTSATLAIGSVIEPALYAYGPITKPFSVAVRDDIFPGRFGLYMQEASTNPAFPVSISRNLDYLNTTVNNILRFNACFYRTS